MARPQKHPAHGALHRVDRIASRTFGVDAAGNASMHDPGGGGSCDRRDIPQPCGCVKNSCWVDGGSEIGVPLEPSPTAAKLDAMNWASRARLAACEPSLTVAAPLALFSVATVAD